MHGLLHRFTETFGKDKFRAAFWGVFWTCWPPKSQPSGPDQARLLSRSMLESASSSQGRDHPIASLPPAAAGYTDRAAPQECFRIQGNQRTPAYSSTSGTKGRERRMDPQVSRSYMVRGRWRPYELTQPEKASHPSVTAWGEPWLTPPPGAMSRVSMADRLRLRLAPAL